MHSFKMSLKQKKKKSVSVSQECSLHNTVKPVFAKLKSVSEHQFLVLRYFIQNKETEK